MTASDVERMGKLTYPYHIVFSKCGSLTKFVKNVNSWAGTQQFLTKRKNLMHLNFQESLSYTGGELVGEHLLMSGALAKRHPFAVFLSTKEVLVGTASRGDSELWRKWH